MKRRAESMKTVAMVIRGSDGDALMRISDRIHQTKKKTLSTGHNSFDWDNDRDER